MIDRLQSACALEEFSPITGQPVLVVDLGSAAGAPTADMLAKAHARMAELPCPTIGVGGSGLPPEAVALRARFDVIVADETELAPILSRIDETPIASMALVQLLRHSERLGLHDALIAESLVYSTLQSGPEFAEWLAGREERTPQARKAEPAVLAERNGDDLELTLNRPERRNAFSAEMRDALTEALQVAVGDPTVGRVVIKGRGPAFCAGGDLDEFGTLPDPATAHAIRSTRNAGRMLVACAERVRVEVHGACVGAGIELPAFARRVVASKDAFFQLPEVAMGLVPGAGGTASIPRRIGRQRTAYMALTGMRVDAETALDWGLVDEIV